MNLDLRHPSDDEVQELEDLCKQEFERIARDMDITLEFENIWVFPAARFDYIAVGFVKATVKEEGYI